MNQAVSTSHEKLKFRVFDMMAYMVEEAAECAPEACAMRTTR
jgi:hypothetical protein